MPGMLFLRQAVGQPAPDFGELGFERCVQLSARRLDQDGAALQGSVGDQRETAAALARQRLADARLQLRMDAILPNIAGWASAERRHIRIGLLGFWRKPMPPRSCSSLGRLIPNCPLRAVTRLSA